MSIEELIKKGEKLLKKGKYKIAKKKFNKAIKEDENNKKAWYGLGTAVYKLGQERSGQEKLDQEKEAISHYNEALKIDPNYIGPLKGKAWIYREMNNLEEAIKCYDKILNIESSKTEPNRVILTVTLIKKAEVLYDQKKYEEALECCKKALELDPLYNKATELKVYLESRITSDKSTKKTTF